MANNQEKLVCPICGEPTRTYMGNARKDRLCGKHADLFKAGKIEVCEDCGKWKNAGDPCECKNVEIAAEPEKKETVVIDKYNRSKCITCGRDTEGLLFCGNCYHKYKSKMLLFRITNCSEVELLDEDYEGRYTAKDGHIVKSKAEKMIDDYLYDHNIWHIYEHGWNYGPNEGDIIYPDFCLTKYLDGEDVYIEYWGYGESNKQYTLSKNYKLKIYNQSKITLVCLSEKDMGELDNVLNRKLKKEYIKLHEINFND